MLKKLKEYKTKNDELSSSATSLFHKSASVESTTSNELDLAIQDELNQQIKVLEQRVKELKAAQEKDATERANLLKRVDVLSAANDRFTEMKDQQDATIEMFKTKCRQLTQQLAQLEEWSDDNYNHPKPAVDDDDDESLRKQLAAMQTERDDARAQLDDEKEHTAILEDRISTLQASLLTKDAIVQEHQLCTESMGRLTLSNQELQEKILQQCEQIKELEARVTVLRDQSTDSLTTIDALSLDSANIKRYLDELKVEHARKIGENEHLANELQTLSERNEQLSNEVAQMSRRSADGGDDDRTFELEARLQEVTALCQYKDAQIMHLNQKVDDAIQEDQTAQLIQEILVKNSEINSLRAQVQALESEKCELENNLSLQVTQDLAAAVVKEPSADVQLEAVATIQRLERDLRDLRVEKEHMEHELQVLNDQVLSSLELEDKMKSHALEMDMKNIEIAELKQSLATVQSGGNGELAERIQYLEQHLQSVNEQWEHLLEQRCAELAEHWRQHLAQREAEFAATATTTTPIETAASTAVEPKDQPSTEVMQKMQEALESQEMEIVTLKEQLAIRSAEYARIASQVDPFGQMSTMSSMTSMDYKAKRVDADNRTAAVQQSNQKSELDLALYMLHQRDMSCEELTEELISLLEERDTLQLKLSNSIRQAEAYKAKYGGAEIEGKLYTKFLGRVREGRNYILNPLEKKGHCFDNNFRPRERSASN